jgi:hypothetical protein
MKNIKALIGNAFFWGAGFTATAFVTLVILRLVGALAPMTMLDDIGMSIRIGMMGAIASVAFSGAIRLIYRGKRLRDINWKRFALAGAVVTGVFVPLFMQTMSVITGGGLVPLKYIIGDMTFAPIFGGLVAAASIRLAQRASAGASDDAVQFESAEDSSMLPSGDATLFNSTQRAQRSAID